MMREIKKQIYLRWDEWLQIVGLQIISFLFGEILMAAAHFIAKEDEIFELGTLMSGIIPVFVTLFAGISAIGICFNVGISMCSTRRRLVPMMLTVSYLECLTLAGVTFLFHHLELWIFRVFYPDKKNAFDLEGIFRWKYAIVVCIVLVAAQALFGMLLLRYGKVSFWILWALWVVAGMGLTRSVEVIERYKDTAFFRAAREVLGIFGRISESALLTVIMGTALILILISCFMLRKQQVTV